jgi:hypothetical protein
MCGWTGNGIFARSPKREINVWKLFGAIGPPRSVANTCGPAGCSRCRRQGSQTYFGIGATNEHGADLAWIFERNLRPAFVLPRHRPASLKCADKSSRAFL